MAALSVRCHLRFVLLLYAYQPLWFRRHAVSPHEGLILRADAEAGLRYVQALSPLYTSCRAK